MLKLICVILIKKFLFLQIQQNYGILMNIIIKHQLLILNNDFFTTYGFDLNSYNDLINWIEKIVVK